MAFADDMTVDYHCFEFRGTNVQLLRMRELGVEREGP